jgi:hypothetical protein
MVQYINSQLHENMAFQMFLSIMPLLYTVPWNDSTVPIEMYLAIRLER